MKLSKGERQVMTRLRISVLGLVGLSMFALSGCSLCCSPYTDDYVTFGSRTPRIDRKHGRLGSLFSDSQSMGQPTEMASSVDAEGVPYEGDFEGTMEQGAVTLGGQSR